MTQQKPKEKINWPTAVIILGIVGTLSVTFSPLIDRAINGPEPEIEDAINKDMFQEIYDTVKKLNDRSMKDHEKIISIESTVNLTAERVDKNVDRIDDLYKELIKKK